MISPLDGIQDALGIGSSFGGRALARACASAKLGRVAALSPGVARSLTQLGLTPLLARPVAGHLELEDRSAEGLCTSGLGPVEAAPALLIECRRVVASGGRVWAATPQSVTRRAPEPSLVAGLFLHAGLMDLEQRVERGVLLTSGRVR